MKKVINWGILGTSPISGVMAKAIQESNTGKLIAIGSRSSKSAQEFANKFSISNTYDDYEKLINSAEIDAVYIGLPNHLHKKWIVRCAQAGKNILCEKPFVISVEQAREVISVIKDANVFCMEGLMYRSHPFTQKLQELIQSKVIGDVKLYNAVYTAHIADVANPTAGGSIRNLGCYPVSLVRLLTNAEPVEIIGTGRINSCNHTDNQASVILKFNDETMAVVSTADDLKMSWQFEVYGTKGMIKVISNPWLPSECNKLHIYLNNEPVPIEVLVESKKFLYTYQIDLVNYQILNKGSNDFNERTLLDSLGNTIVLEDWLQQVKNKHQIHESVAVLALRFKFETQP